MRFSSRAQRISTAWPSKNQENPGSGLAFWPHPRNPSPYAPPLRIEFPVEIYHVTSSGDRRELIFEDDSDRAALLGILEESMQRFDAQVMANCLMGNHDHFVLHTRRANLSRLMRHLNGMVTQVFSRRHRKMGHLFHVPGPFQGSSGGRDAYLLEGVP
jgi:REP element-mobilizing transposase RayT